MMEKEDMSSSPSARAPKLQLSSEQPLTEECWIKDTKKNTQCPMTKKPEGDGRRGTIMIKSNPIPTGWVTRRLENIIPKKFSHHCDGSEHLIRLPSLGVWQRDRKSPGNLTLKASGIWLLDFHRTGGNRDSSLGRHKQNLACTKTQRKGAGTPQETESKFPC